MNKLLLCPLLALVAATPAYATGGLTCSTAGPSAIELNLVIGHNAVPAVIQARLTDNGREVAVSLAQSWIERGHILVDLVDPNVEHHELRLSVRAKGDHYDGSLWRSGKRRWVRCSES